MFFQTTTTKNKTPKDPHIKHGSNLKWHLESHFLSQCCRLPHLRALPYGSVFLGSCDADSRLTKAASLRVLGAGVCSEVWFQGPWTIAPLVSPGACSLRRGYLLSDPWEQGWHGTSPRVRGWNSFVLWLRCPSCFLFIHRDFNTFVLWYITDIQQSKNNHMCSASWNTTQQTPAKPLLRRVK